MNKNPAISIIVPVYKAERYLHHCIDSLLAQTFLNFEILLIDDGSPDHSGEICDKYAQNDKRIRVFHKKNEGVGAARNLGIENAYGEWITFVDSDDYVSLSYLRDFGLSQLDDSLNNEDIIIYQGIYYWKSGIKQSHFKYTEDDSLKSGDSIIEKNALLMDGCPCGKLYNRNLLIANCIRFNTALSLHEDHIFVYTYLFNAQRIITRSSQNYFYRIDYNPNSLTQKPADPTGLIQAGILLIQYSKCLFVKHKIKRSYQRYFITHYGINQLYKALWILIFNSKNNSYTRNSIAQIKKIIRLSFIINNYSFKYPSRFLAAVGISLLPTTLLITSLKLRKYDT